MSTAENNLRTALRKSMELNGDIQRQKGPRMDSQRIINILAGIVFAFLGWWSQNIWSAVQALQGQITTLNVEISRTYVPRLELQSRFDRIDSKLERIDEALKKQNR